MGVPLDLLVLDQRTRSSKFSHLSRLAHLLEDTIIPITSPFQTPCLLHQLRFSRQRRHGIGYENAVHTHVRIPRLTNLLWACKWTLFSIRLHGQKNRESLNLCIFLHYLIVIRIYHAPPPSTICCIDSSLDLSQYSHTSPRTPFLFFFVFYRSTYLARRAGTKKSFHADSIGLLLISHVTWLRINCFAKPLSIR